MIDANPALIESPNERRHTQQVSNFTSSIKKLKKQNKNNLLMLALALTVGMALIGPVKAALWDGDLSLATRIETGHMSESGDVVFSSVVQPGNTLGQGWVSFSSAVEPLDGLTNHKISLDIKGIENSGSFVIESELLNQNSSIPVCFITGKPELIEYGTPGILEAGYQLSSPQAMPGGGGLDKGEKVEGQIRINILNADLPGIYWFKITLPCVQYSAPDKYPVPPGLWSDTLEIHGSVQIIPQVKTEEGGKAKNI
jgi:hypothetical protein